MAGNLSNSGRHSEKTVFNLRVSISESQFQNFNFRISISDSSGSAHENIRLSLERDRDLDCSRDPLSDERDESLLPRENEPVSRVRPLSSLAAAKFVDEIFLDEVGLMNPNLPFFFFSRV